MALFEDSSQLKFWMFTKEQLSTLRANAAQAGPEGNTLDMSVPETELLPSPPATTMTPARTATRHTFMTPGFGNLSLRTPIQRKSVAEDGSKDQELFVKYFLCKIPSVCVQLQLPIRVEATAMAYTQRFYLKNSVKEHYAKDIILAAIFLAGKVEEASVVSAEQFAVKMGMQELDLKIAEVSLLNAIEYHLLCFHPFRSLRGLLLDLDEVYPNCRDDLKGIGGKAGQLIRWSLATDACFVYSPGQIACAAVIQACIDLNVTSIDMKQYLSVQENGSAILEIVEGARLDYFVGLESPAAVAESLAKEAGRIDRSIRQRPQGPAIRVEPPASAPNGRRRLHDALEDEDTPQTKRPRAH